jgi:hypothetical protein
MSRTHSTHVIDLSMLFFENLFTKLGDSVKFGYVAVKSYPRNRPWRSVKDPTLSRHSAHRWW